MADTFTYAITAQLVDAVLAGLDGSVGGKPCRVVHATVGLIADDACNCGQLAATVPRLFGSIRPPVEAQDYDDAYPCGMPYLVVASLLRLTRCVPGSDPNTGAPPTPAALEAAARVAEADKLVLRTATVCKLVELANAGTIMGFNVRPVEAVGPSGLCAGAQMQVMWWVTNPECGTCSPLEV